MTFFSWLRRRDATQQPPTDVYHAIVAEARAPEFYRDLGVPDTLDGRFDLIVMHAALVFRRLRREGEAGAVLAQAVFDVMFRDMDRSLRELGVGDMSVGKHVKKMAQAFYGRAQEYERGLDGEVADLVAALKANIYRSVEPSPAQTNAMMERLRAADAALAALSYDDIVAARLSWRRESGSA